MADEAALPLGPILDRRAALGGGVLVGATAIGLTRLASGGADRDAPAPVAYLGLLGAVAAILLPETDTHRAGAPRDLAFILSAVETGLLGATPQMLAAFDSELDRRAGGRFVDAAPATQERALAALDEAVFGPGKLDGTGWPVIKPLILMSYYSSEEGASHELSYNLVPGHFDPDVVVTPDTHAFANDWTAVSVPKPKRG